MDKSKFSNMYQRIGYTRYKRITMYLENLGSKINVKEDRDQRTLIEIDRLILERLTAVRVLYVLITISYFGIYFSVVSYALTEILNFSEFAVWLTQIVAFFGTTLFVVLLFLSHRLNDLYYQDLNLLSAHAIAIYNKYETVDGDAIYEDMNNYISFINFFKKRYN